MKAIVFLSFILLAACSASRPIITLDYNPTIPDMPPKPSLPIKFLSKESDAADVIKAYVATVVIQKSYIDEVNNMIDSL